MQVQQLGSKIFQVQQFNSSLKEGKLKLPCVHCCKLKKNCLNIRLQAHFATKNQLKTKRNHFLEQLNQL